MKKHFGRGQQAIRPVALAALLLSSTGHTADAESPLTQGPYIAPMYSHVEPHDDRMLDTGRGGTLALGYRANRHFAIELAGLYSKLDRETGDGEAKMRGANVSGLGFLSQRLPGLFFAFGLGYLETDRQATSGGNYEGSTFEAGLGYLFPFSIGRYDFGLRAEARWRHNNGQDSDQFDEADPAGIHDRLFNVGLQLPLGLRQPPAPPPVEEPVRVVEPVVVPPPPPPECKAEIRPGEAFSLSGCGTGSIIVLRGVTFDFDKSRLTPNAKTVLDVVAAELLVHTGIKVEVAGHTDAIGSDEYNHRLSHRRAQAVMDYLAEKGIARERMSAVGFGESKPVADNATEEGRELNRRVELRVTEAPEGGSTAPAAPTESRGTSAAPAADASSDAFAPATLAPAESSPADAGAMDDAAGGDNSSSADAPNDASGASPDANGTGGTAGGGSSPQSQGASTEESQPASGTEEELPF